METFLIRFGLWAVFLASMVEADVVPVLTGVVAHLGFFGFFAGIIAGSIGAFIGDCFWFWLGRRHSGWIRNSRLYRRISKFESLKSRFGRWRIPASHVIYGTRLATMTLSGLGQMSFREFALFDLLGCLTFTTLFASLGYVFSSSASLIIGNVKRIEILLLLAAIITVFALQLIKRILERRARGNRIGLVDTAWPSDETEGEENKITGTISN